MPPARRCQATAVALSIAILLKCRAVEATCETPGLQVPPPVDARAACHPLVVVVRRALLPDRPDDLPSTHTETTHYASVEGLWAQRGLARVRAAVCRGLRGHLRGLRLGSALSVDREFLRLCGGVVWGPAGQTHRPDVCGGGRSVLLHGCGAVVRGTLTFGGEKEGAHDGQGWRPERRVGSM